MWEGVIYQISICSSVLVEFLLKQLDYKPEFSMSDSQLGCASLTIRSQKTRACSLIVNYKTHAMLVV